MMAVAQANPSGAAPASLPYILGVTGASGSIYALRLMRHLQALHCKVHVVASESGLQVLRFEGCKALLDEADKVYDNHNLFAPIASGSFRHAGMVVIPCSMASLGKMACGIGDNLLTRSADVCLKERRKLIVVPREMPMSGMHLRNQAALSDAGAVILPASPSFYHHPKTIDDLVDTVLARVLDHLGLEHAISTRWPEMGS
jgi:flavin prenyltransferase